MRCARARKELPVSVTVAWARMRVRVQDAPTRRDAIILYTGVQNANG